VSVSSYWFRRYIYFVKWTPYEEDIAICSPRQTGKILDADCTCTYNPYSDMVGMYRSYDDVSGSWQVASWCGLIDSWHMASICWLMLTNQGLTRVLYLANGVRTRGPIWRRHVSLIFGSYGSCIKSNGSLRGLTTGPPPTMKSSNKDRSTNPPTLCFLPYNLLQCILIQIFVYLGGGRAGA